MVPRVSSPGQSFQGAGLYYLHDKDALTSERVAFTQVENVPGVQDPEKALGWMAYTALSAEQLKRENGGSGKGRKAERPVWTASFSWDPEQQPTPDQMVAVARSWLAARGLQEHQAVLVGHQDEAHPHVHVIVNLIHPQTGLLNKKALSHSKLASSQWAEAYERDSGKIYCQQRVENNARRAKGEFVRYREPEIDLKAHVTKLYHASDSGKAFQAALAETGYQLAQGKRLVLIDQEGTIHSLSRQIEGVKAKDIRAKLADVVLPDVDGAREQQGRQGAGDREEVAEPQLEAERPTEPTPTRQEAEPILIDRDRQDREWQEALIDAAIQHGPTKAKEPQRPSVSLTDRINALQDRHHAELGQLYAESQQAREKLVSDFDQQYGDHERQLRKDIAHLERAQKQSRGVRRFWSKVMGREAREAEELNGLRRGLENIEWRKSEVRQAVENRISEQAESIRARQVLERQELQQQAELEEQRSLDPIAEMLEHERQALEWDDVTREHERGGPELDF